MSQAVNTFLTLDDRLNIHDNINYSVIQSGQSILQQKFVAQSASPNNINVSCLIPSLQTVIDRRVVIKSRFTVVLSATMATAGQQVVAADLSNLCLANFPFSQAVNTLSVQINNATVSNNYQNNLNAILSQMEQEDLAKYADTTPVQRDFYALATTTGTLSAFANVQSGAYNLADGFLPRGAYLKASDVVIVAAATNGAVSTATITIDVVEPIFVSPFCFGDNLDGGNSGLSGVSVMNFQFNMNSNCPNVIRWSGATGATNPTTIISAINNGDVSIQMTFLTPKPSMLIPLTCSLPYWECPTFLTTAPQATLALGQTFQITSTIISPNCVPDKIFLSVQKQYGSRLSSDNEYYYPITQVNIVWNTLSGILNSATVYDLYALGKKAGMKANYLQYTGGASGTSGANVPLAGCPLSLDFATAIPLMENYFAPGSLGNWTFSVIVTCLNTVAPSGVVPPTQLNVSFLNSGLFTTTSGSSSQYVGLLSREQTLRTAQMEPTAESENNRYVGGSFLSKLKSVLPKVGAVAKSIAPYVKGALGASDNKYADMGEKALGALGYGMSAGAMSGGAISGGRKPRIHM